VETAPPTDQGRPPGPEGEVEIFETHEPRQRRRIKKERLKDKTKKKPKFSKDLLLGAGVGGLGVMLIGLLAFVFLGGGKLRFGDRSGPIGSPPPGQTNAGSRAQTVGRSLDVDEARRCLSKIGVALLGWYDRETRGPPDQFELSEYLEFDKRIGDLLMNKQLTIIWGLPRDRFVAKFTQLVAYETEPDSNGIRVVLRMNGVVEEMNEAEFQDAPKAAQ
jgi:hypothetical protein